MSIFCQQAVAVPSYTSLIGLNADRNGTNRAMFWVVLDSSVAILQQLNRFGSRGGLVFIHP